MLDDRRSVLNLVDVGLGFPDHYVDQATVTSTLAGELVDRGQSAGSLRRLHGSTTVQGRHLALGIEAYLTPRTFAEANDTFIAVASDIGERAIRDALARARFTVSDIDLVMLVTTTGLAAPSIDAGLVSRLGLRSDIKRVPVFGLGCAGGAAGVARCAEYVKAFPSDVALVLAIELCSLTFQRDDVSVANLIATGLFGDGAACAVVAGRDASDGRSVLRIVASRSVIYEGTEDVLGWRIGDSGFRIVLRRDLPDVLGRHLREDVEHFLSDQDMRPEDVGAWVVHPGGPKVLRTVETTLGLPSSALRHSWTSLGRVGNLSSASVLHILRSLIDEAPPPGTTALMIGMGPGFSAELVLFRWQ